MSNNSNKEEKSKGIQQPSLVPKLELPKSGGAIQGIGEKYTANPATGTGNFSVPIGVTAGRGAPQPSLSYSSGSGNSPFGLGWSMAVPSISRKTERNLPLYNDIQDSDTFILSSVEDLVKKFNYNKDTEEWEQEKYTSNNNKYEIVRYRPRTEGLFARIEKWTHKTTGDVYWKSISGENITSIYGETPESRITNPKNPKRIFSWLLCKTFDNKGNITLYEYKQEDNDNVTNTLSEVQRKNNTQPQKYLKRILYGNKEMYPKIQPDLSKLEFLFKVVFDYGEHNWDNPKIAEQNTWPHRLDAFSKYRAGFEIRTRRLCRRVLMFHTFQGENVTVDKYGIGKERLIQSTDINYDENQNITQVNSISKVAYEYDKVVKVYIKNEMPPLEFTYSKANVNDTPKEIDAANARNTPQGLSGNYQFTDLNAEGLNGVLIETAGAWHYRRNLGEGKFDRLKTVSEKPNWSNLSGGTQLSNIESNGQLHLSRQGSNGGYSKRDDDGSWSPFRNYDQRVNIDLSDPDIRYVDLNGDGRPEILILRDELLKWYPNNGEKGFDQEQRNYTGTDENLGPARLFQNDLEGIFLNDMTGDGLSDIVRIRCTEICYWPNLGYGNFGEKVIMDNAPYFEAPDVFHPQNLRLADIDGSGTTDILYLAGHNTYYWLNHSGNGFSDAIEIKNFPSTHKQTTVSLIDLLGNGTACLVWSSPLASDALSPWKYIDIMNSTKPYLLTEIRNNMGSVTRSEYKPSTYFYLKDEREGNPWITKLPFPVHVVHKTEVEDLITKHRFVTEYAYHHGYYDRAEREFRGFGFVEQWDDESFKNPDKMNPDVIYDKPRICTKSWFHTGAWEKEIDLEEQYKSEYWKQENKETFLADSELLNDDNWTAQEIQEAKRALRGQLLRSEVFTEDDSDLKDNPYVVTEARFQVKQLQPIKLNDISNRYAVYISLPLEKVTATYDRNPKDPRLAHELTLEIDDFGNVIKSASIAYPRLYGVETDPDHCSEQYQLKIIYTENEVFNQKDTYSNWYVKGVPLSAKAYEIESLTQSQAYPPFFDRDDLRRDIPTATKKLLSAQVNYYRDDDDTQVQSLSPDKLTFGEVQPLILPYGTYQLIFTEKILDQAYDGLFPNPTDFNNEVTGTLGFLQRENYLEETHPTKVDNDPLKTESISGWWVTGGFAQYDPTNFYTTTKVKDTWGNISEVTFDDIGLLPIKVKDPLDNEITAEYDYRILQPLLITDPNGNRQKVAYDGFGRVIRTAVMGKVNDNVGDVLDRENARNIHSPSDTETSIIEYHHDRFYKEGKPNFIHSYSRETHHNDLTSGDESRWMEARVYSDGFGQELQTKAKVAPGEAKYVDTNGNLQTIVLSDPRWLGSGRTIYDNKGQAVKQYEPYFSTNREYENEDELVLWGVSPFIHYDAIGRVYQTDMPDGTFTKVEFTPWQSKTYDANDTIFITNKWYINMVNGTVAEERAAQLSLLHAETPSIQIIDVLGRPVLTKTNNLGSIDTTKVILDTVGNQLQVIDANGNTASEVVYDLVGRPLKSISNDAGTSYAIMTIDNQPAITWIPNEHRTRMEYDQFRRPKYLWLLEANTPDEIIKEATVYGENFSATPETHNMRGQVWKSYDQAGITEVNEYDFKGAPLKSTRYIFEDYLEEGNWTGLDDRPSVLRPLKALPVLSLNPEDIFTTSIQYDALGRPTKSTAPDESITENIYDEGGALYSVKSKIVDQNETTQVEKIAYNEKGQRLGIKYGNKIRTKYTYDILSYRLTNIHSQKDAHLNGEVIQNIDYTYDAIGNIVEINDTAQQTIFFTNQVVEPKQQFVYDGLNRLIEATGREHIGQNTGEQLRIPEAKNGAIPYNNAAPNDTNALQTYKQSYTYDSVGNILKWEHKGETPYTRDYIYQTGNNRLVTTKIGSTTTTYTYDIAGNIEQLSNHIFPIEWNFENQPTKMVFADSKIAHYRYDAGGERLRKVVITGINTTKERIYLGNYEVYREYKNNQIDKERTTLHIADDTGRICIVETLTKGTSLNSTLNKPVYRYQLSNHLGSVGIELDSDGNIISYEEYHPYGTTAYYWKSTTISQKRYRYTGKERDEESGLSYHSARYYMPWLGRWLSVDPAGMVDGPCLYQYSLSNPVMLRDENGMQSSSEIEGLEKLDRQSPGLMGDRIPVENEEIDAEDVRPAGKSFLNKITGILGKIWSSPNTIIGLTYGLIGHVISKIAGGDSEIKISKERNAIEFTNNPLMSKYGALTFGNTIVYGKYLGPGAEYDESEHEEQHTYQGEVLGPFYFPLHILFGIASIFQGIIGKGDGPDFWHNSANLLEKGPEMNPPQPWPFIRSNGYPITLPKSNLETRYEGNTSKNIDLHLDNLNKKNPYAGILKPLSVFNMDLSSNESYKKTKQYLKLQAEKKKNPLVFSLSQSPVTNIFTARAQKNLSIGIGFINTNPLKQNNLPETNLIPFKPYGAPVIIINFKF
ncbi:Mono(ADP-ribosyl)transferase SpvB [Kordia antarctica]|uniref:Mono(ADP-ribosyl)transferase SpvB n=1 Tax=Kordia antarctica TaxID=1218801 RepID=A0A7L4ZPN3_9FLAO|nr:SpvB/TcaC N-terminal domain-containing protein [Kordia antarctica]QHI38698.1 Mono(ADP-ribosyl)transferase SpvB [Kordia antarctica]